MDQNYVYTSETMSVPRFLSIVVGITATITLLLAIWLLLDMAFADSYVAMTILFYSSMNVYHLARVALNVAPKFNIEAGLFKKLLLTADLHMMILSYLFIITDAQGFLYITDYIIITFLDAGKFFTTDVAQWLDIQSSQFVKALRNIVSSPLLTQVSAVLEICISIQLFVQSLYKLKFVNLFLFLAYFFLVNLAGIATSESHNQVWSKIGIFLREIAAKNSESYGPVLEDFVDKCTKIGNKAKEIFPKRDLKVHLQ